jgi:polyisoprenoid-binding protein YceI
MRSTISPPARRANAKANNAAIVLPRWRSPVGEGANRPRIIRGNLSGPVLLAKVPSALMKNALLLVVARHRRALTSAALITFGGGSAACASTTEALLATEVPTAATLPKAALTLTLTAQNTTVEADVSAVGSHTLRFGAVSGKARFAPTSFEGAEVTVDIDATTAEASLGVVTDIAKDRFLQVTTYPTAKFVARNVKRTSDEDDIESYTMWGDLTLHGSTRTVQVPLVVERAACTVAASSEFSINRRDFKIETDGALDGVVSDTVVMRIAFRYRESKTCVEDPDVPS